MNKAQQILWWIEKCYVSNITAMTVLDILARKDGFYGWVMPDGSRVNLVNGELVEVV